jgi:hypothetical protein
MQAKRAGEGSVLGGSEHGKTSEATQLQTSLKKDGYLASERENLTLGLGCCGHIFRDQS